MKKTGKRSIWISIVVAAMLLTGCGNQTGSADRATGSDAMESVPSTTEVVEVTTEETTTEVALEVVVDEGSKPEAVPATTEIGGGKKKAAETTEEQKPSTSSNGSGHSNNSGSASSGQSTTPKPSNSGSNSGSSGNSGSNNGGSSNSTPSPKPSTPATTEAPTTPATTEAPKPSTTEAPITQHQHVYDQVVVDTPEQSVYHPAEYKTVPAMQCNGCLAVFTSLDAYMAHPCSDYYGFGDCTAKIKVQDEYTETIPAKTHRECKCGARE